MSVRVLAEVRAVQFQQDEETVVANVRVVEDEDENRTLEYSVTCANKHRNWVVVGTDPGEYRCVTCTEWL